MTATRKSPRTFAHRGFAAIAPENTVEAVQRAVRAGANAIEIDVRPCADGTPVVFHDAALDASGESRGLTDATGRVAEAEPNVVTSATVGASDATVPTLADVLEGVPDDITLNVELKSPGDNATRPGEALPTDERMVRQRAWRPFVDRVLDTLDREVLFSSFCEGALAAVRERSDRHRLAVLGRDADVIQSVARRIDADAIHPPWSLLIDSPDGYVPPGLPHCATTDLRAVARREGWTVNTWTVRRRSTAQALVNAGVDGIIADYPGLL